MVYHELLRSNRLSIVGIAASVLCAGISAVNTSIAMVAVLFPCIYFVYYFKQTKDTIAYLQTNYGI